MMNAPEDGLDLKARRYTLAPKDTQSPVMLEPSSRDEFVIAALPAVPAWRPALFFLSVGLTIVGLVWIAAIALSPGGLGPLDIVLLALFVVTLPWYVIGFWNATIGLLIMRFARDPVAAVVRRLPAVCAGMSRSPLRPRSCCVSATSRPERVARLARADDPRVAAARGVGARFHVYVLSDTSRSRRSPRPSAARFGRARPTAWARITLTYRLRAHNVGFKAGNIADFCERWGKDHDFAVMLDADSVMTVGPPAETRAHHADRSAARHPAKSGHGRARFGQRLCPHLPVRDAPGDALVHHRQRLVARRLRAHWGHNAIVRIAPFVAHRPAGVDRQRAGERSCAQS